MSRIDDLKKVYNLASELRFTLIQSLNNNDDLHYARTQFNRDMKAVQGIGEWAMANMRQIAEEDKIENSPEPK